VVLGVLSRFAVSVFGVAVCVADFGSVSARDAFSRAAGLASELVPLCSFVAEALVCSVFRAAGVVECAGVFVAAVQPAGFSPRLFAALLVAAPLPVARL
jgi:hypothetical protein